MKIDVSSFRLGLFLLSGSALLFVFVVLLGTGAFSPKGLEVETYIDGSVQGLDVGSPLKFRGVRIGRVTEIALAERHYQPRDPRHAYYVMVTMELDPKVQLTGRDQLKERVQRWVRDGMRLRLASQGITGIAFMEAEFMDPAAIQDLPISWEPRNPYIPSARTQLARVADSIESIARDLQNANLPEIAGDLKDLLESLDTAVADARIGEISTDVRDALSRVEAVATRLDETIAAARIDEVGAKVEGTVNEVGDAVREARAELARVSDGLASAIDEARGALQDARGQLNQPELRDALARLPALADRVDALLADVEASVASQDQRLSQSLADLRAASASARDLGLLLSRDPAAAAFGQPPTPTEVYAHD